MNDSSKQDHKSLEIARRWCLTRGPGWSVNALVGRGATAPVFSISSPLGELALKIYESRFSTGPEGEIGEVRIGQQRELGEHDCPYLVKVLDGGRYEERLFILMSRAPGQELEKVLFAIPRARIRTIVDQVAQAVLFLRQKNLCHRDIKSANVFISDDFNHATLLDLSVMRDITDPLGTGTDHDGKLPIVATARYSPPEYLFRLLEPGPELWHALDVYQLGGLLHDLIMRRPLFDTEFKQSKENRYRFAWLVATQTPEIAASDVDPDLLLLCRQALDKNWERRSVVQIDDFLKDIEARRRRSLQLIGLQSSQPNIGRMPSDADTSQAAVARLREIVPDVETNILQAIGDLGVRARHGNRQAGSINAKILWFKWTAPSPIPTAPADEIAFSVTIKLEPHQSLMFDVVLCLKQSSSTLELSLPPLADSSSIVDEITQNAMSGLQQLAIRATEAA